MKLTKTQINVLAQEVQKQVNEGIDDIKTFIESIAKEF